MRPEELNRVVVPSGIPGLRYKDGKVVAQILERSEILFIGHVVENNIDEDGNGAQQVRAFAFEVPKPVTRAKAIDAAERSAYNLTSADDVASFNASLARKSRLGIDTEEVTEHDAIIGWVKKELDEIGIL